MKNLVIAFLLLLPILGAAQSTPEPHLGSTRQPYLRDHISLGVGPAIIYGENAGIYRQMKFKILPSFSFAYNYELNRRFDLRGTIGSQLLNSGGFNLPVQHERWAEGGHAIDFVGQAYYADIMPVIQLNPNTPGRKNYLVNVYAGLGVGIMHVRREDTFMIHERTFTEDNYTTVGYIPARLGLSTLLSEKWSVALEGSIFYAFDSSVDGNSAGKRIGGDVLMQGQVVLRRFLFLNP